MVSWSRRRNIDWFWMARTCFRPYDECAEKWLHKSAIYSFSSRWNFVKLFNFGTIFMQKCTNNCSVSSAAELSGTFANANEIRHIMSVRIFCWSINVAPLVVDECLVLMKFPPLVSLASRITHFICKLKTSKIEFLDCTSRQIGRSQNQESTNQPFNLNAAGTLSSRSLNDSTFELLSQKVVQSKSISAHHWCVLRHDFCSIFSPVPDRKK